MVFRGGFHYFSNVKIQSTFTYTKEVTNIEILGIGPSFIYEIGKKQAIEFQLPASYNIDPDRSAFYVLFRPLIEYRYYKFGFGVEYFVGYPSTQGIVGALNVRF